MGLSFQWHEIKAPAGKDYWSSLWTSAAADEAGVCVIRNVVDKQYYISGVSVNYPRGEDIGPFKTSRIAMVAAETMVLLDELPQSIKDFNI